METAPRRRESLHRSLRKYGLLLALIVIYLYLGTQVEAVFSTGYAMTLLRQVSINGLLAVGVTFVLLTGGVDLSLGALMALTGVSAALVMQDVAPNAAAGIAAGIAAGLACGLVNGFIITKGRVAPFIVTLGMMTAGRGMAQVLSDGRPVTITNAPFKQVSNGDLLGIPIPVLLFAASALLASAFLKHTRTGRYVYATGGNEAAARASGISVDRIKILAYTISGAFAGLGGVLLAARMTTGQPNAGVMAELDAIAAVVIGGTSLSGGVGGIGGTVLGALLIGLVGSALDILNVSSYYQDIVKGAIIVGAVWLDARGKRTD